jgi:predicted lipoprotein with Yx(FWY)xxD motif
MAEASLMVANDPNFGPILVDGEGMALYMFTKDAPDTVNCAGQCLENWPPLLTQGSPTLGDGIDPALVGTAPMPDGTMIVTYNHMPLYYYIKDAQPGDVMGQDVGQVWYVVSPEGMVIGQDVSLMVASDPNLGPILVDGKGMALYMFTKDAPDTVNCAGQCLENWPPFITMGNPTLGEGIDPALVGTAPMADGSMIVTYNHMPMYYYINDAQPGDVMGQDVGQVWYVVAPDGKPVGYTMP